jgi:hypothetical protein
MITTFVVWILAFVNYLVSGARIQGGAYSIRGDDRDYGR